MITTIAEAVETRPAGETPVPKLAFRIPEAARAINSSEETVRRLIRRGKLRALSSLRHKLIPLSEIERFLKADLK